MPRLLIVGALDPSGGAGLLADVRAALCSGVKPLACLSAPTIQSSRRMLGAASLSTTLLIRQIETVLHDDGPAGALKIGALTSAAQLRAVLHSADAGRRLPAVYDPVLAPTAGPAFLTRSETEKLRRYLYREGMARLAVLTPNLDEYAQLFGEEKPEDLTRRFKCHLLLKGGHAGGRRVIDRLYVNGELMAVHGRRRKPGKIRGTGCVLSSLIASRLALGHTPFQAFLMAETAMDRLITEAKPLAPGGPLLLL